MKKDKASFLGRGWSFPPEFEQAGNQVKLVEKELDIRESLFILLSTSPGERLMHPDYGCGLNHFVFEPTTNRLHRKIKDRIEHAILLYEPRIDLIYINIEQVPGEEGILYITIDYSIIQTNSRQNMVYPMYLIEGTQIQEVK